MNMSHGDRLLVVLLVLAVTVGLYQTREKDIDNPVRLAGEQGSGESEASPIAEPEAALNYANSAGNEREITQHVSKTMGGFSGLPITIYNLQKPLLPDARLLDFREFQARLWFAGNAGLYSFDLASERWFAKTREHGLPRDTAYDIERTENSLFLYLLDWNEKGHLTNNLRAEFDGDKFLKTNFSEITAKANGRASPDTQPLEGKIADYHSAADIDWYCVRGKHAGRDVGFINGGVIKFNPSDSQSTIFTDRDGLQQSYCTSITAASDQSIWVSHWDEEVGLSYLSPNTTQWKVKTNSANGIPLGGPSVYGYGDFLFIAQQRALVIYDPISDMAIDITEDLGLSGFIVTDVQATADGRIWATSYRYARGGDGQAASGLISFKLSDVARLFSPDNLQNSLRDAREL